MLTIIYNLVNTDEGIVMTQNLQKPATNLSHVEPGMVAIKMVNASMDTEIVEVTAVTKKGNTITTSDGLCWTKFGQLKPKKDCIVGYPYLRAFGSNETPESALSEALQRHEGILEKRASLLTLRSNQDCRALAANIINRKKMNVVDGAPHESFVIPFTDRWGTTRTMFISAQIKLDKRSGLGENSPKYFELLGTGFQGVGDTFDTFNARGTGDTFEDALDDLITKAW